MRRSPISEAFENAIACFNPITYLGVHERATNIADYYLFSLVSLMFFEVVCGRESIYVPHSFYFLLVFASKLFISFRFPPKYDSSFVHAFFCHFIQLTRFLWATHKRMIHKIKWIISFIIWWLLYVFLLSFRSEIYTNQVLRILAWDTLNHLVYYLGTQDKKPGQQHLYVVKDPVNADPRR